MENNQDDDDAMLVNVHPLSITPAVRIKFSTTAPTSTGHNLAPNSCGTGLIRVKWPCIGLKTLGKPGWCMLVSLWPQWQASGSLPCQDDCYITPPILLLTRHTSSPFSNNYCHYFCQWVPGQEIFCNVVVVGFFPIVPSGAFNLKICHGSGACDWDITERTHHILIPFSAGAQSSALLKVSCLGASSPWT